MLMIESSQYRCRLALTAGACGSNEREGWPPADDEFDDPTPGLTTVEHRYRLGDR